MTYFSIPAIVAESMQKSAILGINFLTKCKANINILQETIQLSRPRIKMNLHSLDNMKNNIRTSENAVIINKIIILKPKACQVQVGSTVSAISVD